jgi:hypothetical protein
MQRYSFAVCALLSLVACDRPKEPDARQMAARALRGTLSYPQSSIVKVSAGTDAAELQLASPAPADRIAAWYREALPLNGWELKNEGKDREGALSIYAEKEGRPLWITLRPNPNGQGTTYTLIGAIVDSTATAPKN